MTVAAPSVFGFSSPGNMSMEGRYAVGARMCRSGFIFTLYALTFTGGTRLRGAIARGNPKGGSSPLWPSA